VGEFLQCILLYSWDNSIPEYNRKITLTYLPRTNATWALRSSNKVLTHDARSCIETWTGAGNPTLLQTQRGSVIYDRTPADASEQSGRWMDRRRASSLAGRQTVSDSQPRPRVMNPPVFFHSCVLLDLQETHGFSSRASSDLLAD